MKKYISFVMLFVMLFITSTGTIVKADMAVSETGDSSVIDYVEGNGDKETTQDVEVVASKGSTFTVCVPKHMEIVPGVECEYRIGIRGDITENQKIVVEPIDGCADTTGVIDFVMKNEVASGLVAKEDVNAVVTPYKTVWLHGDVDIKGNDVDITSSDNQVVAGNVFADISAGQWSGTFSIRIALEDVN